MRLYISGPMSGVADHNFPAFRQAAHDLRDRGYDVSNPADNGADPGKPWAYYLRQDIKDLMDCHGIATLPGWTESRGASLEVRIARALGMSVRPVHEWPALRAAKPVTA